MIRKHRTLLLVTLIALVWFVISSSANATQQTVGLFVNDEANSFDGYTLYAPINITQTQPLTYLIDNDGQLVHSWATGGGMSSYLLEDGTLARPIFHGPNPTFTAGGVTGSTKEFDWDGNVTWEYVYNTPEHVTHHDIQVLPNGNVLMIAYELKTEAEAIAAGRDPTLLRDGELWPDHLIEVQPTGPTTGDIVWEWHMWDHLVQDFDAGQANYGVVADHPELIDINFWDDSRPATGEADWIHMNSIDYNPDLDQVLMSARHDGEIWVIDHSTTMAESAGHAGGTSGKGGDILFRWGNPEAYGAGGAADNQLFLAHDAEWVPTGLPGEGNITVFNNGLGRPGDDYSSIEEIVPPVDIAGAYPTLTPGEAYGPAAPVWSYTAPVPTDFFSNIISGAQRLPNGNTLILSGVQGNLFEVTPAGDIVWRYVNPAGSGGPATQGNPPAGNLVFRSYRYALDYEGLADQVLTPSGPIEIVPDTDSDGLPNFEEIKVYGTDPDLADTDGDSLSDYAEIKTHLTDPLLVDTDGGGVPDALDLALGDPLNPSDDAAILAADTDGDGCANGEELGPNEILGGRRDPFNAWDLYDTDANKSIDLFIDIFAVAGAFGADADDDPPGEPDGYSPALDRSAPLPGGDLWDMQAPDGTIDLFIDVFGVLYQFGHSCT